MFLVLRNLIDKVVDGRLVGDIRRNRDELTARWESFLPHFFTAVSRASGRRPVMYTRAPLFAKACAIMRPIPVPPPVTTQTHPSTLKSRGAPNLEFCEVISTRVMVVVGNAR